MMRDDALGVRLAGRFKTGVTRRWSARIQLEEKR